MAIFVTDSQVKPSLSLPYMEVHIKMYISIGWLQKWLAFWDSLNLLVLRQKYLAPGRFAQKPVPPGTVRAKKKFERDVSSQDDSRIFPKIDFKVLFIKIYYQLNAMDM